METFLGPFKIKEVGQAYRQSQFDLQDEIAGSQGEWVCFDDFERMKRHYPEVHTIVKRQIVGSWESEPSKSSDQSNNEKHPIGKSKISKYKKTSYGVLILFVISCLFFFFNTSPIRNLYDAFFNPLFYEAKSKYSEAYNEDFANFMKRNSKAINIEINKNSALKTWLPFLRSVAFNEKGVWPGLPFRVLKGNAQSSPSDCSFDAWKRHWISSKKDWSEYVEGRFISKQWWAQILFWDSEWIKFRSLDRSFWLSPNNYYEACLMMAHKSLQTVPAPEQGDIKANILSRLAWQKSDSKQEAVSSQFEMFGSLWVLSCIESSDRSSDVDACFQSKSLSNSWKVQLGKKAILKKLLLLTRGKNQLSSNELSDLADLMKLLKSAPPIDGIEYSKEIQFYDRLQSFGGDVKKSLNRHNSKGNRTR